ncbi:MAG TPA: HIT family protein [Usitatibacter sp.]|jgi:diadenosine tetraphosphate (Ap4A) HIT family hydrolase|nr:HIT family protein [Usitatibacter sp.]
MSGDCEFCERSGGAILWQNDLCRVVQVDEPGYPGYCRVILARHVRETTDLDPSQRMRLAAVVFAVEDAVRETMRPDKMNVASLGNVVPHLHWHVVPRFRDDAHFPSPVWCAARREIAVPADRLARAAGLGAAVRERLLALSP